MKKFLKETAEIPQNNEKLFTDFFGDLVLCGFDKSGNIRFDQEEDGEFYLQEKSKILSIKQGKAFLIDHTALVYQQFNLNLEKRPLRLTQILSELENAKDVKQYFLDGIKYQGQLAQWNQNKGYLYFNYANRISITREHQIHTEYRTKITYHNQDQFEGTLLDGLYHDFCTYRSKTQVL